MFSNNWFTCGIYPNVSIPMPLLKSFLWSIPVGFENQIFDELHSSDDEYYTRSLLLTLYVPFQQDMTNFTIWYRKTPKMYKINITRQNHA
jgi:hypothetical protein